MLFSEHTGKCHLFFVLFSTYKFFFSFLYCSGFCHILTWISHGFICSPHPDPPSHLPLYPIPLGHLFLFLGNSERKKYFLSVRKVLLRPKCLCVLVAQSCPTLHDPMDYRAHQAPLSMGFSGQEYWSGLPFPSPSVYISDLKKRTIIPFIIPLLLPFLGDRIISCEFLFHIDWSAVSDCLIA